MTAWARRDLHFRAQYGISRSAYYVRRAAGLSHDEAIADARRVARPPYRLRVDVSHLLRKWR